MSASVLMVLATAIPQDSVSAALADQTAFAASMASSLSAGNTPAWYQSLPADVKSLLPILYASDSATPTPTPTGSASVTPAPGNMTSHSHSPSMTGAPPQQSTNAASRASAVGLGAAGVVLGLLAL